MDMMTRSAILAGSLVIVAIAAAAGWWFLGPSLDRSPTREPDPAPVFDQREGSLYDEFGQRDEEADFGDRITIRTGDGLTIPQPPSRARGSLLDGPQFGWSDQRDDQPFSRNRPQEPMPRGTPAERVEADCRIRGGGSYACRCLVRLARTALEPAQFDFLSTAQEAEPRPDRLASAGLELTDLPALTVRLVELDANAQRRCGAGLKP
jgi:hypothetical protein